MKYKYFIVTSQGTRIITGNNMFIDGDYLYIYDGESLCGMYKVCEVVTADRTVVK
jgi:hypothetical protein